jgi:NAD(P)-dependent dehydrogenase (short-subunit alcohol dehydrogenase family)
VVNEINSSGGQAVGISTDLSDSNSVKAAFDQIAQKFPGAGLSAAVFNSSGSFVRKPFLEVTEEEYSTSLDSQAYVSTQAHSLRFLLQN